MSTQKSEFRTRGRSFLAPMCKIEDREVVAFGRWLRIATLNDEEWLEGRLVTNPVRFIAALRASGLPADIFAFSGPRDAKLFDGIGHIEMDNAATIRTDDYKAWWEGLSQETRRNARLAAKKGIEVRSAAFDDDFAAGIKAIYDETPVRQGRKFWHYGKDLDRVKRENSSYLDRSEFLGAYYTGQLVGFMKFVYIDDVARIMQILCLDAHRDKRPMTALIAKAVEVCHQKGKKHLIYGKFAYGGRTDNLAEFKRRMGFEVRHFPRYYIPLSLRGRIAIKLGAHAGWRALLSPRHIDQLVKFRTWWLGKTAQLAGWRVRSLGRVK